MMITCLKGNLKLSKINILLKIAIRFTISSVKIRGLIIILNKTGALLSQHAPYVSRVYMELDGDPLFTPQLLFFVRAFKSDFGNGFKKDVNKINSGLNPMLLKLNLGLEFIFDGMVHEE